MPYSPCIIASPFDKHGSDSALDRVDRAIAVEAPIAIEVDGIAYAVMMATPADLDDFVTGFMLSEGMIARASDMSFIDVSCVERGIICRVARSMPDPAAILERVRHRTTDSACGLCGLESLEAAIRPLPRVPRSNIAPHAIFSARANLADVQHLNLQTGATHAAAFADADGNIRLIREDVGRHNAFDKLIGAMTRDQVGWADGFALLTSRCSYDLVDKAARAGCPFLATLSAPTSLAIAAATEAGIGLAVLVRDDNLMIYRSEHPSPAGTPLHQARNAA